MRPHFRSRLLTMVLAAVCLALFLPGCSSRPESGGPVDECGPYQPSDGDIKKTLAFGKAVFAPGEWIRSYTVEPYKISVTRHNDGENAVSYIEYLIFTCGYGQKELDSYFGDEAFNVTFSGYDSHKRIASCTDKKLTLYEYDVAKQGTDYHVRYWVRQDTSTRILVNMLVFPKADLARLDEYSLKLFPELTACP